MRILWLTTDDYPFFGTTVNIINKILIEGQLKFDVDGCSVVSCSRNILEDDFYQWNGIAVYKIKYPRVVPIRNIWKNLSADNVVFLLQAVAEKALSRMKIGLKTNSLVDDKLKKEILNCVRHIDIMSYDVIIPIAGDYTAVQAAVELKREFPEKKLVFYQVDPCSTNMIYSSGQQTELREYEKNIYKSIDALITMPCIYDDVKTIIDKKDSPKIMVSDLPLVCPNVNKYRGKNKKIICTFSGLIYAGIRDPQYTLRLFEDLLEDECIELWFIGVQLKDLPPEFQNKKIRCYGIVPLKIANELISKSDVLINIGNKMRNQVPSKIFDYISTGKPVINICKNRNCPTIDYFLRYKLALNLYEDDMLFDEQKNKLKEFILAKRDYFVDAEDIEQEFKCCTPKYCAKEIFSLISNWI